MNDEAMLIRLNEILENKQLSFSERHSMREAIKRFQDLPFVDHMPRGFPPMPSITAPNIRDDGYISHREWEPLKSLRSLVTTKTELRKCK